MLVDCFTCLYKVVQYVEHLVNGQNQEMELFSGTKTMLDLEDFSRTEGVFFREDALSARKIRLSITFSQQIQME